MLFLPTNKYKNVPILLKSSILILLETRSAFRLNFIQQVSFKWFAALSFSKSSIAFGAAVIESEFI